MRFAASTVGVVLSACVLGCAGRVVPVATGAPDEPRAAWVIKAGEYGSERELCRSDRDLPCVIEASSADEPRTAVVSVYLYPAGDAPTTYKGALLARFMGSGEGGYETALDYSIKPGELPSFVAAIGPVTTVPGDYEFRMALFAEVGGHRDPHQFQQAIPVRVVPAGSNRTT
jgi:hypothetical protein